MGKDTKDKTIDLRVLINLWKIFRGVLANFVGLLKKVNKW